MTRQISRHINVYSQIQKTGSLPTIPEILLRLLDSCESDQDPVGEITAIVNIDPGLSFKVLQLANSPYFGSRTKFTSIASGIDFLGLKCVRSVALNSAIHQVFERKRYQKISQFSHCAFWYHSVLCAHIAKRIAQKSGYQNHDEAYLGGLLHDIGRLFLFTSFPKEHEAILLETGNKQNILWAEEQLLGLTHSDAGSWLVRKWNMDSMIADALKYHHESLDQITEAFPLVKIVYLANLLSEIMANNDATSEAGSQLFRMNDTDIESILQGAMADVGQIAENLGLQVADKKEGVSGKEGQTRSEPSEKGESTQTTETTQVAEATKRVSSSSVISYPVESKIIHQIALINRVKNNSLLSGFLEKFIQAGDTEEILISFEQAVHILFNLKKVLLFLPDTSEFFLEGRTSATNSLNKLSRGMILPVEGSTSKIVETFNSSKSTYLRLNEGDDSLADAQILRLIDCQSVLLVPLRVNGKTTGVVLFGLPEYVDRLANDDLRILKVLIQQVGLNLYIEQTKLKQAEEIEAERMAIVSMTAKKVAHEINNPLGIINNYLKTMSIKNQNNDELQQELGIIGEEIERISKMVNQMGLLSPSEPMEMGELDVNDLVTDIVQLAESSLFPGESSRIVFLPEADLPLIHSSRDGVKQILLNLIKNSAEALEEDGKVTISTRGVARKGGAVGMASPGGVEIIVRDDGPGLPKLVRDNLFKPFITTKNSSHSGLGLSIVQKIVLELKGSISCDSEADTGTTFRLYFPVV